MAKPRTSLRKPIEKTGGPHAGNSQLPPGKVLGPLVKAISQRGPVLNHCINLRGGIEIAAPANLGPRGVAVGLIAYAARAAARRGCVRSLRR